MELRGWPVRRQRFLWVVAGMAGLAALFAVYVIYLHSPNGGSLRRRELVVVFDRSAPSADHLAARARCGHLPGTSPEPIGSSTRLSDRVTDVRFRVDNASDAEVAELTHCVMAQRGVVGVESLEPGGM